VPNKPIVKTAKSAVSYDRNAAVSFASSYAYRVCPDNIYLLTTDCDKNADCAHFVSWALINGGIDVPTQHPCKSYYPSYRGINNAMALSRFLYDGGYVTRYPPINVRSNSNWQRDIKDFLVNHSGPEYRGDVIFFVYADGHAHAALYLGEYTVDPITHGALAQHSYGSGAAFTWSLSNVALKDNCGTCTRELILKDGKYVYNFGYGSYDDINYGPISFITNAGSQNIDHFSFYHINTSSSYNPPSLTSGQVSPTSGNTSTTFTYSVYYSDPEGASPTTKYVYIDGTPYTMSGSGSGSGSTYTYQKSGLSVGTHNYYFEFSDGVNTVRLPTSGTYSGPTVSAVNNPPTLSNGSVNPQSGTTSTTFTYYVSYYDPEGVAPSVKYVYIYKNNNWYSYSMTLYSGSPSNGVYYYSTTFSSAGTYYYYFYFDDGSNAVWLPGQLSYYAGPTVSAVNNPPGDKIGVYRPSTSKFFMRSSTGSVTSISFGISGDIPIIGDWNGDNVDEIGVYRPSDRRFYMRSSTGTVSVISFGITGDKPIVGIWN